MTCRPLAAGPLLGERLIGIADAARGIHDRLGLRPYRVSIVRTRWTGGRKGQGTEEVVGERDILPTPRLVDLDSLNQILQPIGLDEVGGVRVDQITGTLTENDLNGYGPNGEPIPDGESVYWQIEFRGIGGKDTPRYRRFVMQGTPQYRPDRATWSVSLRRAHADRDRFGVPQ